MAATLGRAADILGRVERNRALRAADLPLPVAVVAASVCSLVIVVASPVTSYPVAPQPIALQPVAP